MNDPQSPLIVERRHAGWTFRVDATHAPAYVMVTGVGSPDRDAFLQSVADVVAVMDEAVAPGAGFCPVIFNARQALPEKLTVAAFMRVFPGVIRRVGRVFVVISLDQQNSNFMQSFIRVMMSANPAIKTVYSLEEAYERLGVI